MKASTDDAANRPAMAERGNEETMSYIPGKPVWHEINTPDTDGTLRFYGEVLGWKAHTAPMGGGQDYTMFRVGDEPVQGGVGLPHGDRAHWIGYVSVEDVDAVAKAAVAHGGQVIVEPFDVPDVGRMAGVMDPEGAVLFAIRGAEGDAPSKMDAGPGHFVWLELMSDDPEKAGEWYKAVFGYDKFNKMDMPNGPYYILERDGHGWAGVMGKPAPMPTYWLPYVTVDDVEAAVERAERSGGKSYFPPFDAQGVGRIGQIEDAQGAPLGLLKPTMPQE